MHEAIDRFKKIKINKNILLIVNMILLFLFIYFIKFKQVTWFYLDKNEFSILGDQCPCQIVSNLLTLFFIFSNIFLSFIAFISYLFKKNIRTVLIIWTTILIAAYLTAIIRPWTMVC